MNPSEDLSVQRTETPDVQPLLCPAGRGWLRRFVAHLLIRVLILSSLPAHLQVRALLFPVWPLACWAGELSEGVNRAGASDPAWVTKDPSGNRATQIEENGSAPELTSYGYDPLDRLTSVTIGTEQTMYGLDKVGNRTSEIVSQAGVPSKSLIGGFDEANRLKTLTDNLDPTKSWTFDWQGGQLWKKTQGAGTTTPTVWEYRYDHEDMLVEALRTQTTLDPDTQMPSTGTITAMRATYDQAGRRLSKIGDQGVQRFVYADDDLLAEYNSTTGAQLASYNWAGGSILAAYRPGTTHYFGTDALGSTTTLTDPTGETAGRLSLGAWGEIKDPTQLTLNPNRVGYTGHYYDAETSLTYAKARYLDNALGMFTTQDSLTGAPDMPQSLHRFSYVQNGPTRYIDPDGHRIRNPRKANRGVVTIDDDGNARMGALLMEEEITVTGDPIRQIDEDVKLGDRGQGEGLVAAMDAYEEPLKASMVVMAAPAAAAIVAATGGAALGAVPGVSAGAAAFGGSLVGGAVTAGGSGYTTDRIYGASSDDAIEHARGAMLPGMVAGGLGFGIGSAFGSGSRLGAIASGAGADLGAQGTMMAFGLQDRIDPSQLLVSASMAAGATPPRAGGVEFTAPRPGRPFSHSEAFLAKRVAYQRYAGRQAEQGNTPEGINTWAKTSGYDSGIRQHQINTSVHGNTAGTVPATLYAKFRDGVFQKWGITKHSIPARRYSGLEVGDEVRRLRVGPRNEMLIRERRLAERFPGPENREPWAGWRNPNHPQYRGDLQ